jgi:radical SAM-linked protein
MVRQRTRIRFRKQGDLRWIGHRDLVRSMERIFRRAGLKLGMSEGFHPKPRMSFPSALALGIEGHDEVMELELAEEYTVAELRERLERHTVAGLSFPLIEILPPGTKKAQLRSVVYQMTVPAERCVDAALRVEQFLADANRPIYRGNAENRVDLRPSLAELTFRDGVLAMRIEASRQQIAGPRDILASLGLDDLETTGALLKRALVEIET